ncbi:MAG: SDR family NAD(P)-dependent oxidoreductase, partial [Methylobacter sp.]
GLHSAKVLASHGYTVFGAVRTTSDQEKLLELAKSSQSEIVPIICEVTNRSSVSQACEEVKDYLKDRTLNGLINNAGIVITGPLLHLPLEDWEKVFDVNVTGVLRVIQAFTPLLDTHESNIEPKGRIINISSVSGIANFPLNGAYCSSKHALESLTVVLRRELSLHSISVSIIQPGNVNTDIWNKIPESSPYSHTDYGCFHQGLLDYAKHSGPKGVHPDVIVKAIIHALESPQPKSYYFMPGESLKGKLKFILNHCLFSSAKADKKFSIKRPS